MNANQSIQRRTIVADSSNELSELQSEIEIKRSPFGEAEYSLLVVPSGAAWLADVF